MGDPHPSKSGDPALTAALREVLAKFPAVDARDQFWSLGRVLDDVLTADRAAKPSAIRIRDMADLSSIPSWFESDWP